MTAVVACGILLLNFLAFRCASLKTSCNVSPVELSALNDLFTSTNGNSWTWQTNAGEHWNFDEPDPNPCHPPWQGVVCSNQTLSSNSSSMCHVSSIQLQDYNLRGTIPLSIGNLTELLSLQLNNNALNGTIPSTIGSLPKLSVLELVVNDLTGSLPESFAALTASLSHIYLYANYLTGHLPPHFFNTSGSALSYVEINDNHFSGPLPDFSLPNLVYIDISENRLSGAISSGIADSIDLELMYAYDNFLGGSLTERLGELRYFQQIEGYNNEFTGTLPQKWSEGMINVNFCPNHFSGQVLDSMANLTSLIVLCLCNNVLSGTIPGSFNNFSKLVDLVLQDNAFSGSVALAGLPAVQYLQLQGNTFSGSISFTPAEVQSLEFVDFSSNQFTGTLPVSMFTNTMPLASFAASTNCLSGSIPDELCSLSTLTYLGLDGLSTSTRCRNKIFPHVKSLKSFYLQKQTAGGVPECLFAMPAIETLLVSGNSIFWSFPEEEMAISPTLAQLSLSHNNLGGSIPEYIQQRNWTLLDLSFNRLSGTVHDDNAFTTSTSLTLRVNRLSGAIPANLKGMTNVDVLSGNVFGCNFARSSLPPSDPSRESFACGSNSFDQSMLVWVSVSAALLSGVALCVAFMKGDKQFRQFESVAKLMEYYGFYNQLPSDHALSEFRGFLRDTILSVLRSTVILLLIMMPLYATLKVFYGTVDHQYAWTVSAAYLSGVAPAILLLFLFAVLLIGVYVRLNVTHFTLLDKADKLTLREWLALFSLVLINCLIMITVNGCYVAVRLAYNTKIEFLAQIAMSLFKLVWNDVVVGKSVVLMRRFLHPQRDKEALLTDARQFSKEMIFTAFMVLFNTSVAPVLATAAVDPNCFYNVIVAPSTVTSNLPIVSEVRNCQQELRANNTVVEVCGNYTAVTQYLDVTYDPPFIYSYQCSSAILTNYAAVYVYMLAFITFAKPLVLYLCTHWYDTLDRKSCLHMAIKPLLFSLLKPLADLGTLDAREFFNADSFVLKLMAKISILMTFGVVFPPLAVVVCVAVQSESLLNWIIIGRFLTKIDDDEERKTMSEALGAVVGDCSLLMLQPTLRLVLPFAAVFLSFFVFDTYGNAVGFRDAVWAPVLLTACPWICMLVTIAMKCNYHTSTEIAEKSIEVEMKNL